MYKTKYLNTYSSNNKIIYETKSQSKALLVPKNEA